MSKPTYTFEEVLKILLNKPDFTEELTLLSIISEDIAENEQSPYTPEQMEILRGVAALARESHKPQTEEWTTDPDFTDNAQAALEMLCTKS